MGTALMQDKVAKTSTSEEGRRLQTGASA